MVYCVCALNGAFGLNTSAGPNGIKIGSDDTVGEPDGSHSAVPGTGMPVASSTSSTSLGLIDDDRSLLNTRRSCVPPASPWRPVSGGVSGASPAASGSVQVPAVVHATLGETCCN